MKKAVSPVNGYLNISGMKIYVKTLGRRSGTLPSLLVLHGGPGGSHDIMIPGIEALSGLREVVLYDQRGSGRSDPLTEDVSCTLADNIADLEAVRRRLDLDRIDLLGHSWGALLGMAYALEHRENLRRLILVTPAQPYYPNPSWDEFLGTLSPEQTARIAGIRENRKRSEVARRAAVWRIVIHEYFHNKRAMEEVGLEKLRFSPEVGGRIAEDLYGLDLRPRLPRLEIPTLIIAGRHDRLFPPKYNRNLADLLPDTRLEIFDHSAHFPFLEEKDRFADTVEAFLG